MYFERPLVRRQFVASQLAAVPGVVLNIVLVEKAAVAERISDQVAFYNFVADSADAPWDLLRGRPAFLGPGQLDGLQAADQYCGMLRAGLEADEFGGFEAHHLLAVRPQIRYPDGFEGTVLPGTMAAYPWWPEDGL